MEHRRPTMAGGGGASHTNDQTEGTLSHFSDNIGGHLHGPQTYFFGQQGTGAKVLRGGRGRVGGVGGTEDGEETVVKCCREPGASGKLEWELYIKQGRRYGGEVKKVKQNLSLAMRVQTHTAEWTQQERW
jgi:hypothetical protein